MTEVIIRLEFQKETVTLPEVINYILELVEDKTLDFEIVKSKEPNQ